MTETHQKQVEAVVSTMQRHPRIVHQSFVSTDEQLGQLRKTLPFLVPFGVSDYHRFLPVLDWDHRLPSRVAILRLYAYYSDLTTRAGIAEFTTRTEQIKAQDEYRKSAER